MKSILNVSFYNQSIDPGIANDLNGADAMYEFESVRGYKSIGTWWANPAMLYLKMHHDQTSEYAKRINWNQIMPDFYLTGKDFYIKQIIENETDVLCIGLYTWTWPFLEEIVTKCKKALPNMKVVIGGPDVAVHNDPTWLDDKLWIDYAVYGDGQYALSYLIDCFLLEKQPVEEELSNTAWLENGKLIKTESRIFKEPAFFKRGPWWHNRDIVRDWLKYAQEKKVHFQANFETSRNCPYACTFCDWSSGTTNKVFKWNMLSTFKDLVFLAQEKVLSMRISDANFGQWKQDVDIAKFIVTIRKKYPNCINPCETNWSKLNKERNFEIMDMWLNNGFFKTATFSYSFQDLDPKVLASIHRPDIPWQEHKKFILEQHRKHPTITSMAEFVAGMPYQTLETVMYATVEAYRIYARPNWYPWQYLPNAPVRNAAYRDKYQIKLFDFKLPLSIFPGKDFDPADKTTTFKVVWSLINGLDEAILTFFFVHIYSGLNKIITKGENTDALDVWLTMLDNEWYDKAFLSSFKKHITLLFERETDKAWIPVHDEIINIFHLIKFYSVFDKEKFKEFGANDYSHLTDEEKIKRTKNHLMSI